MSILVGDASEYTVEYGGLGSTYLFYHEFTASATGTAVTAYAKVRCIGTANIKLFVYRSSDGQQIGTTGQIAASSSLAWASGSISCSIEQGQAYCLGVIFANDGLIATADSTSWSIQYVSGTTYANPPGTVAPGSDTNGQNGLPAIWIDGTLGGGATPRAVKTFERGMNSGLWLPV